MGELREAAVPEQIGTGVACVAQIALPERTSAHTAVVPIPARDSSRMDFWNTKRLALTSVRLRKSSSSPGRHLL